MCASVQNGTGCVRGGKMTLLARVCVQSHIIARHDTSVGPLPCVKRFHTAIMDAVCLVLSLLPVRPTHTCTRTHIHRLGEYSNMLPPCRSPGCLHGDFLLEQRVRERPVRRLFGEGARDKVRKADCRGIWAKCNRNRGTQRRQEGLASKVVKIMAQKDKDPINTEFSGLISVYS